MSNTATRLDEFIEAYESAQHHAGGAALAEFLPPREHPLYASVLCELVRVDLEYAWQRGESRNLEDYRAAFPELFAQHEVIQELAYEEYRLRRQAGEPVSADDYAHRYGISTAAWPAEDNTARNDYPAADPAEGSAVDAPDVYSLVRAARVVRQMREQPGDELASALGAGPEAELFRDLLSSNPAAAEDLAQSALEPPRPGTDFLGFRLVATLGRGAFGQVFLARQGDLANRLVAVKVTASLHREPQALAQLQHTHITPIYSLHVRAPHQAVCMPYLGATTLADLLRAVRDAGDAPDSGKFVTRLLEERARERGVPMSGPESLSATGRDWLAQQTYVDAVLWMLQCVAEGLAHAHERGIIHRDLKPANVLLTDDGVPMLLDFNLAEDLKLRASLPGAVIGGTLPYMSPQCLEALLDRREHADARSDVYAVGVLLFELLTGRHPFALPKTRSPEVAARVLAERRRGAPRLRPLNSAISPAAEAIVRRCLHSDAANRYQSARELAEDLRRQRENLPLRFAREPSWRERTRKWLRRHPRLTSSGGVATVAGVALLALAAVAVTWSQRVSRLEERASSRGLCLAAMEHSMQGRFPDALLLLERAAALDSQDFRIWFDLGACREQLGRDADALAAYETCIALAPGLPQLYVRRAAVARRQKRWEDAKADLTEALRLQEQRPLPAPQLADLCMHRGLVNLELNEPRRALEDLNQALALPCPTRAYFIRARVRARLGDPDGARKDTEDGLRLQPQDEKSWLARGWARLPSDPKGALADFEQAQVSNPRSAEALQNQAHVLAEHLHRTEEGIAALDRLVQLTPESAPARASRGVLYARLGKRKPALVDAHGALERDASPATVYQVGGIYALLSKESPADRAEALRLLGTALRQGYGWDLVARDPELAPIRHLPEFLQMLASLRPQPSNAQ